MKVLSNYRVVNENLVWRSLMCLSSIFLADLKYDKIYMSLYEATGLRYFKHFNI